jgi:hypothetical protein
MTVKNKNDANGATEEASEKKGTEIAASRPQTRRFVAEQERLRKEKEAKENQPRRSDRDHDVSSSDLWSLCGKSG